MDFAEVVNAWFQAKIAVGGEIARHTAAYNHLFQAKAELVSRLAAAGDKPDVEAIVSVWFQEHAATGELARHGPAYDEALAAKDDLVARLQATAAPAKSAAGKPAPAQAPQDPEPAAQPAP